MADKNLVVGNWKMNCNIDQTKSIIEKLHIDAQHCDIVICPPYTSIFTATTYDITVGAQDCHFQDNGAHTGDISTSLLKDLGCEYVILGHSERRQHHRETSKLINKKALNAHKSNITTIICIGETIQEREEGKTKNVLSEQLKNSVPISSDSTNTIIAYEPIWAIGTGKVASLEQIEDIHDFINEYMARTFPLFTKSVNALYGGSVKPENAKEIMKISSVGGVLVGGASINPESFNKIIEAA